MNRAEQQGITELVGAMTVPVRPTPFFLYRAPCIQIASSTDRIACNTDGGGSGRELGYRGDLRTLEGALFGVSGYFTGC